MDTFAADARSLFGLQITTGQIQAFEIFTDELAKWNERINLTAITDVKSVRVKHYLDSLSCLSAMRLTPSLRVIDIGSGAGFPGIPLKIISPGIHLTIVDSVGKKTDFCRHMVERLGLRDVDVIQARAEEIGQNAEFRESFDWAVARAVAELPVLAEYLLPLVKVGGFALAQKGESGPAEAQSATESIRILGGMLRKVMPVELPGVVETRYLIIMAKVACTPGSYPRRPGLPSKKPLGSRKKPGAPLEKHDAEN